MSETIRSKSSAVKSPSDLPPPRPERHPACLASALQHALASIQLLHRPFAAMAIAFYAWRLLQWKTERPPGRTAIVGTASASSRPRQARRQNQRPCGRLGMPSKDLAVAIADAVREHVPPASLSSVAAHEPSGTAVQYLAEAGQATSMQAVSSAFEAAVGLDEPPSELGAV
ncbi:hypothetical protein BD414DRAFT_518634 [Trametes punicea]|nr:hypothetical protein BD414DRAFT_518634 [Trametes punicea]